MSVSGSDTYGISKTTSKCNRTGVQIGEWLSVHPTYAADPGSNPGCSVLHVTPPSFSHFLSIQCHKDVYAKVKDGYFERRGRKMTEGQPVCFIIHLAG